MTNGNRRSHRAEWRISLSIIGFLAVVCLGTTARAGDNSSTDSAAPGVNLSPSLYLTLGVGGVSGVGPAAMAALTGGGETFHVTARFCAAEEFAILSPAYNTATDYGLMAGGGKRLGVTRFHASAGVGITTITSRGREIPYSGDGWHWTEYETVTKTAPSIPLQFGVDFGGRYASGGLALVANLNETRSYVGMMFTLGLGKLRPGT
jgi:hypothetical protein